MATILTPGYLYWNGTAYVLTQIFTTLTGPAGGDLSGSYPNPSVINIQGNHVSPTAPADGQALTWISIDNQWRPTSLGGDVTGAIGENTVTGIQNNPIISQTLGVGQSNYALVWSGTAWSAQNVFLNQSAGGDLGDFYPNPTTRALWHAAIPEVLPSNPSGTTGFVVGNVLQVTNVTANSQALGYGALNLASNVTGTLAIGHQADQNMGGDISGTTASATVIRLQNIPVENIGLGLSQDGYVLTYVNAHSRWEPAPSTTGASLAGDVVGATSSTSIAKLQGTTLTIGGPGSGQALVYNGSAWVPTTLGLTLSQDVTGSTNISGTAVTSVVAIQNNPVKFQALTNIQDGYVLTWINSNNRWEAIPNAGGSGAFVAGGDLSGSAVDQTVIKINGTSIPSGPTTNTVLVCTGSNTSSWNQILDANVSNSAAIQGSKISPNFGGQNITNTNNITASNLITGTSGLVGPILYLGATPSAPTPTVTTGSGVPGFVAQNGSIYLRNDGTTDGTESIYSREGGIWVPVGASAIGAAGGDLSGFYPNPTVIAIQKNPIVNTLLGPTEDGYVLTWDNTDGYWKAEPPSSGSVFLNGDVTGPAGANTVVHINGTSVPASPSANQVLVATSGSTATWQLLTNTEISSTAAIAISKLAAGTSAQVLLNNSVPTPTWTTLSGDVVVSNTGITTVNKIQGVVISGTPSSGQILTATSASAADWQNAPSGSFTAGGDLSGSSSNQTVIGLQTVPISNAAPTNGQVLTYDSISAKWEPQTGGGGGGVVIQDGGTVGANIILSTPDASEIDSTQNGVLNLGNAITGNTNIVTITGVTGTAGVGSPIQITFTGTLPLLPDGNLVSVVKISGITGTTEANGIWQIGSITSNTFQLADSFFTNTYISGGSVYLPQGIFGSYSNNLGGDQNYIDGYYSTIIGGNNNFIGYNGVVGAPGDGNVILGGQVNTIMSQGGNNFIIGTLNIIGADSPHTSDSISFCGAIGYGNRIEGGSSSCYIIGNTNTITNVSLFSNIEGQGNVAYTATNCHLEGNSNTINTGTNSHVEGTGHIINSDNYSHVEGFSNTLNSSYNCHVEGGSNTVNNVYHSHIQGFGAASIRTTQDAMASGFFAIQGDAQVNNLVFRGYNVGTITLGYNFATSDGSGLNFNLVATSTTIIVEAVAQDITTNDVATFQQTHLINNTTGTQTYVGVNSGGTIPIIYTTGTALPFSHWTLVGSVVSGNFVLTFTDSIGTDNIAIVANVRFIENNAS